MVGLGGFVVDSAVLWAMLHVTPLGPYYGRVVSFLSAASFTWWGNRRLTFPDRVARSAHAMIKEWGRFILANGFGGLVNYGVYAALIAFASVPFRNPFVALFFGAATGLVFNFSLSRLLVFRHPTADDKTDLPSAL